MAVKLTLASLLVAAVVRPGSDAIAAPDFDPERILTDAQIRHADSMSLSDVTFFLARRGGLNAVRDVDPVDGLEKSAAQLIYDAAQRYDINPQYLLALLQKESSIVETSVPTARQLDWAAGYALCDGCRVDDPLPLKYKGFARQVDAGAGWMDWFLKGGGDGYGKAGEERIVNGTVLVPANSVTAALYSYTPHLHGNQLLWNIMQRWFPSGDMGAFPDGTLVRNRLNGAVAAIQGGRFRPILKKSVLVTRFRGANIVDLDEASFTALERGKRGSAIKFPDLSLVETQTNEYYLLVGGTKRRIPTAKDLSALGFNPEEIESVSSADLADYDDGAPLTADTAFPLGRLLQDKTTGGVYYAESGVKHPLLDPIFLKLNFAGQPIEPTDRKALDDLETGTPVSLPEGTLVKAPESPVVYLISGGKKRPFADARDFKTLGFKFANVLTVTAKTLALHPAGAPLDLGLPDPEVAPVTSQ